MNKYLNGLDDLSHSVYPKNKDSIEDLLQLALDYINDKMSIKQNGVISYNPNHFMTTEIGHTLIQLKSAMMTLSDRIEEYNIYLEHFMDSEYTDGAKEDMLDEYSGKIKVLKKYKIYLGIRYNTLLELFIPQWRDLLIELLEQLDMTKETFIEVTNKPLNIVFYLKQLRISTEIYYDTVLPYLNMEENQKVVQLDEDKTVIDDEIISIVLDEVDEDGEKTDISFNLRYTL